MTPELLWKSLSPSGYFPLGAGYFFAASSGVIGVATGAPPVPCDPGGTAPGWFAPEGSLAFSLPVLPLPVLPWPTAVLEKIRVSELIATTEIIVTDFVFMFMIKLRNGKVRRTPGEMDSKKF